MKYFIVFAFDSDHSALAFDSAQSKTKFMPYCLSALMPSKINNQLN
ncbi:MAG: hypothetical protein K9I84_14340 [Leadbetterella sp.]|nr:hypothetical protein [Leadbetterella sp.]